MGGFYNPLAGIIKSSKERETIEKNKLEFFSWGIKSGEQARGIFCSRVSYNFGCHFNYRQNCNSENNQSVLWLRAWQWMLDEVASIIYGKEDTRSEGCGRTQSGNELHQNDVRREGEAGSRPALGFRLRELF